MNYGCVRSSVRPLTCVGEHIIRSTAALVLGRVAEDVGRSVQKCYLFATLRVERHSCFENSIVRYTPTTSSFNVTIRCVAGESDETRNDDGDACGINGTLVVYRGRYIHQ